MKIIKDYFIESTEKFPDDTMFLIREEDKCHKISRKECQAPNLWSKVKVSF